MLEFVELQLVAVRYLFPFHRSSRHRSCLCNSNSNKISFILTCTSYIRTPIANSCNAFANSCSAALVDYESPVDGGEDDGAHGAAEGVDVDESKAEMGLGGDQGGVTALGRPHTHGGETFYQLNVVIALIHPILQCTYATIGNKLSNSRH